MSQVLYLLRHAKAEPWTPGCKDFDRFLCQRGIDHMLRLSAWMKDKLPVPGSVLCSSSRRTRDTLSPFFDTWPDLQERTHYLDDIYEASSGTLHALAEGAFESSSPVMMVGHNPGFEYFALALLRDSGSFNIHKMATGTLVVIEFPGGYENDSGSGVLHHWITPKN